MPEAQSLESGRLGLAERAPVYAWLSRILCRELEGLEWERLRLEPARSILTRLDSQLEDELSRPLSPTRREVYAEEFARLFLLPGGVSPVASHWTQTGEGRERTRNEIVAFVDEAYRAIAREPVEAEPWGRLPKDHIAVIFDLVAEAQRSEDAGGREVAALLDRELLGPWITRFGHALHQRARVPLYRALSPLILTLHADE